MLHSFKHLLSRLLVVHWASSQRHLSTLSGDAYRMKTYAGPNTARFAVRWHFRYLSWVFRNGCVLVLGFKDWVELYSAGSSELSDARAIDYGLPQNLCSNVLFTSALSRLMFKFFRRKQVGVLHILMSMYFCSICRCFQIPLSPLT